MKRRAVFLDRDGVLNVSVVRAGKPYPPDSLAEFVIPDDVPAALAKLSEAGFLLVCCTNQPDVGRGKQRIEVVEEIHAHLRSILPLDDVYVCYDGDDSSSHRKPNPGMLLDAAEKHDIDLRASFMIGDRWRDVEAGRRAGCTSIFIDVGYTEPWPVDPPIHTVATLMEAAELLIACTNAGKNSCSPSIL